MTRTTENVSVYVMRSVYVMHKVLPTWLSTLPWKGRVARCRAPPVCFTRVFDALWREAASGVG